MIANTLMNIAENQTCIQVLNGTNRLNYWYFNRLIWNKIKINKILLAINIFKNKIKIILYNIYLIKYPLNRNSFFVTKS